MCLSLCVWVRRECVSVCGEGRVSIVLQEGGRERKKYYGRPTSIQVPLMTGSFYCHHRNCRSSSLLWQDHRVQLIQLFCLTLRSTIYTLLWFVSSQFVLSGNILSQEGHSVSCMYSNILLGSLYFERENFMTSCTKFWQKICPLKLKYTLNFTYRRVSSYAMRRKLGQEVPQLSRTPGPYVDHLSGHFFMLSSSGIVFKRGIHVTGGKYRKITKPANVNSWTHLHNLT